MLALADHGLAQQLFRGRPHALATDTQAAPGRTIICRGWLRVSKSPMTASLEAGQCRAWTWPYLAGMSAIFQPAFPASCQLSSCGIDCPGQAALRRLSYLNGPDDDQNYSPGAHSEQDCCARQAALFLRPAQYIRTEAEHARFMSDTAPLHSSYRYSHRYSHRTQPHPYKEHRNGFQSL